MVGKLSIAVGLLLLAASLSACGFYLRGSQPTSRIDFLIDFPGADSSPLARDLRRQLAAQGVLLGWAKGARADQPLMEIAVSPVQSNRRIVALGLNEARDVELQLSITLFYRSDLNAEFSQQQLAITRQYSYSLSDALGSQSQEDTLKNDMRRELAQRLIDYLARL